MHVILATGAQIIALKKHRYCVVTQKLHGENIGFLGDGAGFYLKRGSDICYVEVIAEQPEVTPEEIVPHEPSVERYLVCAPAAPPTGALTIKE